MSKSLSSRMSRLRRLLGAVSIGVAAAGCAALRTGTGGHHGAVTNEDLAGAGHVTLYEALQYARPNFLRTPAPRGTVMSRPPLPIQVYVDGLQMAGFEHLDEIMAQNVAEVRYLNPSQANSRFGTRNSSGALLITMK